MLGVDNCLPWSFLFKTLSFVVCIAGFVLQSYEIMVEFLNERSSIGIAYNVESKIPLPAITICPAKTMRYPIDKRIATEQEFIDATYDYDDLIMPPGDNVTAWKFKSEVRIIT